MATIRSCESVLTDAATTHSPSLDVVLGESTGLRLRVALLTLFKSAHEPEKKLYRSVYAPRPLCLHLLHRLVAAAVQISAAQLSRYVVVNERDATLIETPADLARLRDGDSVQLFERR